MKPLIVSVLAGCTPALVFMAFCQDPPPPPPPPPAPPPHEEHAHPDTPKESEPAPPREHGAVTREFAETMKASLEKAAALDAEGKKEEADALRARTKKRMQAAIEEHQKSAQENARKARQDKQRQRAERIERAERDRQRQRLERDERPADRPGPRDRRPEGPPPTDLQRQLDHVEQAIGHLRDAGLPDPAANLERVAQRLRQALHDQRAPGAGPDGPPRPPGPPPPNGRFGPDGPEGGRGPGGPRDFDGPPRPGAPVPEAHDGHGPRPDDGRRDDEIAALRREVEALKATVKDLCRMAKPDEGQARDPKPDAEKHH